MLRKIIFITCLALSNIGFGQQISGGIFHSVFLCSDGRIKSVGRNSEGQLGLGNRINKVLPEPVPNIGDIKAVQAGYYFTLFLKQDSTVWVSGANHFGQLGLGHNEERSTPVQINSLSGIVAISTHGFHSLFLKNDGTVWACGMNSSGQLGTGNINDQISPVQVNNLSGIMAIASGSDHSLFLKNDGTVWGCGSNWLGQLGQAGDGDYTDPIQLTGLTEITAIAAGDVHSLFLKSDGTVWTCGSNSYGQCGAGNQEIFRYFVQVKNINGIKSISAGGRHSLFLKNNGTVWACGMNNSGQLGMGNEINQFLPVQVPGIADVAEISCAIHFSLFLKNNGTVWSCGYNVSGQLGIGNNENKTDIVYVGVICDPPTPPVVDMSNFPTSVCLGSTLNIKPHIGGSNPDPKTALFVDNSIQITNPKAIASNSNSVFVLNDNSAVSRYGFDGSLLSNYPNLTISSIQAFTADDSNNLYLFNGDGKIYKCDSTGDLINTQSVVWQSTTANQLVITQPVNPADYPENLFLIDALKSSGTAITGINTHDNNSFSNSTIYPANNYPEPQATSMSVDNFYANKRALLADPSSSTLHSRILYPPSNGDYEERYLVDSALTAGLKFDYIHADTVFNFFTVSSSSTGILALGANYRSEDGGITSYLDTSLTSMIKPVSPVGIISTPHGSAYQFWVADRGQNRLLRAFIGSYVITPDLPDGLWYDPSTGKVQGSPSVAMAPQTYQIKVTTPYGTDSSQFTFGINTPSGLNNSAGSGSSSGQQNDGLTIKYFEANNCEKLIDIADNLGGSSPGYTRVSQTVYPIVSVIANDQLIRRATQIKAANIDTLQVNVTFYYTYDDIQLYKQSTGSSISNDTASGTMIMAVLQMHDLPNGGREPIIHSPITAKWVSADQNWKAVVPVTKFSEFYAGDTSTLQNFKCTSDTTLSMTVNANYFIWNYDTLFSTNVYRDTFVNKTGCDSVVTLNLTLKPNGVSNADLNSGIHIYPNPSKGVFYVKFDNQIGQKSVSVSNLQGQRIYSAQLNSDSVIDLSGHSNGVYFISIQMENSQPIVMRVIKW